MSTGLIGSTGFVGSNLASSYPFNYKFNSQNIHSLSEQSFDMLICSAAPGSMFEANANPKHDWENIELLIKQLKKVKAGRFILISTIAVYESFDSKGNESTSKFQKQVPYGFHRRLLEEVCLKVFPKCFIIRLPALIGEGLKKNLIFDILNPIPSIVSIDRFNYLINSLKKKFSNSLKTFYSFDNQIKMFRLNRSLLENYDKKKELENEFFYLNMSSISFHNQNSTFQFYNLFDLWKDIKIILTNDLKEMNLVTEPLKVSLIYKSLTKKKFPENTSAIHIENIRSINASLWNEHDLYILKSSKVLIQLENFFLREQKK